MKAIVAGDGGFIYADHFPSIDDKVLQAAIHRVQNMHLLSNGEQFFISNEGGYKLLSLTDTDMQHLDYDELWNNCERIQLLNLLHNKLESLPPSLQAHYSTLNIATLSYNRFEEVPEVIFSLQNLENLNMIDNSISVIPQSISLLRNLTHLYLSHNNIFSLPNSFSTCENLNVLCLDNNHLSHIPSSVRKSPILQTLELHHNNLQDFQVFEDDFKKLKHLSLHRNRLQVLPHPFQRLLNRLDTCSLHDNPFPDPKLCKMLVDLNNCARNKGIGKECIKFTPRKGSRILVMGACGSGKTSIIQVLCKDKYVTPVQKDEHNHTIGIEQHVHHFESYGRVYELSMWDFAGEDSYLMMNYLFFSEGTLVWLAVNLAQFKADLQSYQTMIGIWLRAVVARVKNPSIWIIGTHSDQCSLHELNEKRQKLYEFVADECKSIRSVGEHGLVSEFTSSIASDEISFNSASLKVFTVSNTYKRDGYDELSREIRNIPFSSVSNVLDDLPIKWHRARLYLRERASRHLVEDHSKIVDNLCQQELATNSSDAESILDYLHETGDVLNIADCQSENNIKKVFLDVMQLIYILKQIFCHDLHQRVANKLRLSRDYDHRSQTQALLLVSEYGIIAEDILKKLWSPLGVSKDDMQLLSDLLKRFKMAYQVVKNDEICYLFPFLLKPCNLPNRPRTDTKQITIHCEFGFIPCGLFEKLLCCALPYLAQKYKIHRNMLEGYSCNDGDLKLRILCVRNPTMHYDGYIEVHVEEVNSTDQLHANYSALWQLAIDIIRKLKQLISVWHKMRVSMVVLCPLCVQRRHCFPLILSPTSTPSIDIKCKRGDLKVESVIPPNRLFLDGLTKEDAVDLASKSQSIITNPKIIATISGNIASEWKSFARKLNLVESERIAEIEYNYRSDGCQEMCAQMLLMWAKHRKGITTVGDLAKAIKACSNCPSAWINALKETLKVLACGDGHSH